MKVSLVIPAYNEENRITSTLEKTISYLDNFLLDYEIIVVNDGSYDKTVNVVNVIASRNPYIKLINLPKNSGKGFAVRTGMLSATGELILFMDADGATPINEIAKLIAAIEGGADIAIASRSIKDENTRIIGKLHRKVMRFVLNFIVRTFLRLDIYDTQCGFKVFKHNVVKELFSRQRIFDYGFDIEILFLAKKLGYKIAEIPVNWCDVGNSKLRLIKDSVKILLDIFKIKHNDAKGLY